MAEQRARPLSPHLGIWRWGPGMAASIFHRISGSGLTVVGLAVLTWWTWIGVVVLVGLTWAFFQHLFSGIRHLVMDTGQNFDLRPNKASAIFTFVASVVVTAAIWLYLLGVVK